MPRPLMTLKAFMAKKQASAARKEKRAGKALYLWPKPAQDSSRRVRTPKTARQRIRLQIDALWAILVRRRGVRRFGGLCEVCQKRPGSVAYHVVSRIDEATRWDLENGVLSCAPCNFGEMMNRGRYRAKHVKLFGHELIERLEAKARTIANFSMADLEAIKADLTRQIQTGIYEG